MNKLFLILGLLINCVAFSQKEKGTAYVALYKDIAIKEMQRSGVPAAITLAQGMLESGYGESVLSQKSNNHFGIKCKLDWAGEKVYHDDDASQECFRKYNNVEESYKDHSDFLKNRPYYTSLFTLEPTDFEGWAKGLKKCGYATEKDYPQNLIKVINEYNLNDYTLIALNRTKNNITDTSYNNLAIQQVTTSTVAIITNSKPVINVENNNKPTTPNVIATTIVADEVDEIAIKKNDAPTNAIVAVENYPSGIFTINGTKVFWANEGTSVLAIAAMQNISLEKLLEYNDLEQTEILEKAQLIFIERKQKKGIKDFHLAASGESLHQIAQKEGVRMEAIVEYNSTHKKLNPLVGEKIYLKNKAPIAPKMSLAISSNTIPSTSIIN